MPAETLSPARSLTLVDYTRASLIVPELREQTPPGIIKELSQRLLLEGCVPDLLPFYNAALNQELLGDSGIECGVAFPHARLHGLRKLAFAFGRANPPVSWGNKGSAPAEFVFLLAIPATDGPQYLHLLASLARLGQRPDILEQIRAAREPGEILRVFSLFRLRST